MYEFESRSGHKKPAKKRQKSAFSNTKLKTVVNPVVSFKDYLARQMMLKPYKKPSIVRPADGDWFIQYYYEIPDSPGRFKAHRVRVGINYIKHPIEKERAAKEILEHVKNWLKEGHSPYDEIKEMKSEIKEVKAERIKETHQWSLSQAIDEYLNFHRELNKGPRTMLTYGNYTNNFKVYLKEKGLIDNAARYFTESDLLDFLKYSLKKSHWSPRTYNNYLKFFSGFFKKVHKLERKVDRKVTYDFITEDLELMTDQPQRNKAFTKKQIDAIKAVCDAKGFNELRDYLEWIFLSMMRPAEIRELIFSNIDEDSRQIRIIGKTGDRLVPISDQLIELVSSRTSKNTDLNDYVFGAAGKPGPHRMGKMFFLDQFKEVRESLKLSDKYTVYSMKPTAVIMMIKAGFKDQEIMVLSGHKTTAAFEAYKRDLVIDNTHVMKGKLIDF